MNLILTLLLAYIQVVQAQAMFPVENMEKEGALQGLHQALDDRFSVAGGTTSGVVVVGSSLTVGDRLYVSGVAQFQGVSTFNATVVFNSSVQFNAGVFGEINQSTYTLFDTDQSITGSALGPCLSGSTITLSTDLVRVLVTFSGAIDAEASTSQAMLAFLVDGAFPTGVTSSLGLTVARDTGFGASLPVPVGFSYLTRTALTAGSHSFCLTAHGGSGASAILDCNAAACNFQAMEHH